MPTEKDKIFESAQKYAEKNQFDRAIRELDKILQHEPNDIITLLRIAALYERKCDTINALQYYLKVANIYIADGAQQKALAVLKQAIKFDKHNQQLIQLYAELCQELGMTKEALEKYGQLLYEFEKAKDVQRIIFTLESMIRVDTDNYQLREKYILTLLDNKRIETALAQLKLTLSLLYSKNQYSEYIKFSRLYLKLVPNDLDILKNVASIYQKSNHYEESIQVLLQSNAIQLDHDAYEIIIQSYLNLKKNEKALAYTKELARYLEKQNADYETINRVWIRAKNLDPSDPEVQLALMTNQDNDEIPLLAQSAITVLESSDFHLENIKDLRIINNKYNTALEYYKNNNLDKALETAQDILRIDKQNIRAHKLILEIYQGLNNKEELVKTCREIAKILWNDNQKDAIDYIKKAFFTLPSDEKTYDLLASYGIKPELYGIYKQSRKTDPNTQPFSQAIAPAQSRYDLNDDDSERTLHNWRANSIILPPPIRTMEPKIIQDIKSIEPPKTTPEPPPLPAFLKKHTTTLPEEVTNEEIIDVAFDNIFNAILNENETKSQTTSTQLTSKDRTFINETLEEIEFYLQMQINVEAQKLFKELVNKFGLLPEFEKYQHLLNR